MVSLILYFPLNNVLACTPCVPCQPVPTDYQHAVDLSQGFLGVGPGGPGGSEGVDISSPPSLPAQSSLASTLILSGDCLVAGETTRLLSYVGLIMFISCCHSLAYLP